jgi:hypothetical protein
VIVRVTADLNARTQDGLLRARTPMLHSVGQVVEIADAEDPTLIGSGRVVGTNPEKGFVYVDPDWDGFRSTARGGALVTMNMSERHEHGSTVVHREMRDENGELVRAWEAVQDEAGAVHNPPEVDDWLRSLADEAPA